jgi:hypothetical protein
MEYPLRVLWMTDFLSYWMPATASRQLDLGGELFYAASNQYGRIQADDRVYIVTAWPGGQLVLLGRILVGQKLDRLAVAEILVAEELWEADWYILAQEGTAEPISELDLSDIAAELRFEGENPQLNVARGRIKPQQLQTMRRLTPATAALLDERLRWARAAERRLAETAREVGHGFGDPLSNREVEARAVRFVTKYYQDRGWSVQSLESQNLGFDLLCILGDEELKVEVKGARATGPAFILTENELAAAETDDAWQLAIVTEALTERPHLYLVSGRQLEEYFVMRPLAYRGTPTRDPTGLLISHAT